MNHTELIEKLKQISKILDDGKELISEEKISEFQTSVDNVESSLDDVMKEGRLLRLGIVGEVKAGKSSFLNALLFDGKDVLPKAPTPMTAALTRIKYSEVPQAKVVFYSQSDWEVVRRNAEQYDNNINSKYKEYCSTYDKMVHDRAKNNMNTDNKDMKEFIPLSAKKTLAEFEKENRDKVPLEYSSCKELLEMIKNSGVNIDNYLGKEEIVSGEYDGTDFFKKLDQYVGADGKFTPIVKYTELQMNNPMREGIEVIDTPGLNDPIRSRGRTTQKFLVECDAVFLVGYCGQFLGADDMGLILSVLPDEGIKKAVLIGSKLDSAILQYPSKGNPSFEASYFGTIKNCSDQARDNLNECNVTARNEKIITQIKESLPPLCVSSVAYSAGRQMQNDEPFGAMEKWLVDNFTQRYSDFAANADTLLGLANITDVKESVFAETKAQKDAIISERIASIVDVQKRKFLGLLEDINVQVRNNQNDLKKYDLDQLEEKIEALKEKLDSVRIVVRTLFQNAGTNSRRMIEDMVADIGLEMSNHLDFEVSTRTKTTHRQSTTGHLFWKKTIHWDEVDTIHTAEIADVEDNIKRYYFSCVQMINDNFKALLKIDQLKDSVKAAVLSAFEQNDKDFDENRIILPLESALNRISIPQVEINQQKYLDLLDDITVNIASNGAVKNDNISQLKRDQDRVLVEISQDIIEYLRQEAVNIDNSLQNESATFIDNIVDQLEENVKKVQDMLQNKQETLQKFDAFTEKLKNCKSMIQG